MKMKNRKYLAWVLTAALLLSLCSGLSGMASAADTDLSAELEPSVVEVSDGEQLVRMSVKTAGTISVCGIGFTVTVPPALELVGIEHNGEEITYTAGDCNLDTGRLSWMEGSLENVETEEIGTIVIGVPSGIPAGHYLVSVNEIKALADFGAETVIAGESVSTILTVEGDGSPELTLLLSKSKLQLEIGETATLTATVLPEEAEVSVAWSSSDETVATVTEGVVTAVSEGETVVTASAGEQSASCTVTVTAAEPDPGTDPEPGPGPGPDPEEPEDSEELKFHKERALATLDKQYRKYSESDYDAAEWAELTAAYETGREEIAAAKEALGAFIENNVIAALNTAMEAMQAVPAARTHPITVAVSMDANTLGLGFLIEPTLVTVDNHEQASVVIAELVEEMAAEKFGVTGAGLSSKGTSEPREDYPWIITGDTTSGFYLAQVYWPEQEDVVIPDYVLSHLRAGSVMDSDRDGHYLGEFDYTNMSGWMYSVSDGYETEFPGVGASGWQLSDGEVMRWQFTVYGYGSDLGADNTAWGQTSIVDVGDKTALTWAVAELRNSYTDNKLKANAVYLAALDVLTDPEADQSAVDAALRALNDERFDEPSPGGPGSGDDSGSEDDSEDEENSGSDGQNEEENDPDESKGEGETGKEEPVSIRFEDVAEDAWYCEPVRWAVENRITNGVDETHFAPDAACTRAQIVTFLWRAAGSPKAETENPFEDVAAGAWYYDAVLWAVSEGITAGMDATHFAPAATCTRAQAVTFLWRANGKPSVSGTLSFVDVEPESWYGKAVKWAADNGITVGVGDGLFGVSQTCTRAQIVTFLYRSKH